MGRVLPSPRGGGMDRHPLSRLAVYLPPYQAPQRPPSSHKPLTPPPPPPPKKRNPRYFSVTGAMSEGGAPAARLAALAVSSSPAGVQNKRPGRGGGAVVDVRFCLFQVWCCVAWWCDWAGCGRMGCLSYVSGPRPPNRSHAAGRPTDCVACRPCPLQYSFHSPSLHQNQHQQQQRRR